MKILTLWGPYATLMAIGAKTIETRSWYTSYRGPLVIHAAKGGSKNYLYPAKMDGTLHLFEKALEGVQVMPGHIVGVVNIVGCYLTGSKVFGPGAELGIRRPWVSALSEQEISFGDYSLDRYGWITELPFRLPDPIPYKGGQGLRDLDQKVVEQIKAQGWRGM